MIHAPESLGDLLEFFQPVLEQSRGFAAGPRATGTDGIGGNQESGEGEFAGDLAVVGTHRLAHLGV